MIEGNEPVVVDSMDYSLSYRISVLHQSFFEQKMQLHVPRSQVVLVL